MPNPPDEFYSEFKKVTLPSYIRDTAGKVVQIGVSLSLSILDPPDPPSPQAGALLLETGDHILTESGFNLLLG